MTDRAYTRISLDYERSGAIAKQRAQIVKRASADVVWYSDESVSGAVPFEQRPGGARLLADLRPGDRVLFTRLDRAARNVDDLRGLVKTIQAAGADVVFTEQGVDTSGPMGEFLLTLLAAVAQLERDIVAERARETRASFRAEGRFGGGPVPFGFQVVENPAGRGLVLRPHETDADTARDAIARVLAGVPQRKVAADVGLKETGFARWLRNPALAGIREVDGEAIVDPEAALLTLAEWDDLKAHLATDKAWTRDDGYGAALACGVCGERLYYGRNRKYPDSSVYRCRRAKHADGEPAAAVSRRAADPYIEDDFLARFGADPVLEEVVINNDAARREAVALAKIQLTAAQRAFAEAVDEDAEDAAQAAQRAAKRALRAAEEMPTERVTETRDTGLTHAELWEMLPPAERVAYVVAAGPWVVAPGRGLTIEEKVRYAGKTG